MYSVDLSKIETVEFVKLLKSIDLLPGRQMLLNGLDEIAALFESNGIKTIADIQILLKNKSEYSKLSKQYNTTNEYLTILNREINSYKNKPIKLAEIPCIAQMTLSALNNVDINTTKDAYESLISSIKRNSISNQTGISLEELEELLGLCDLLRINGVGPIYAMILYKIGIKSARKYSELNTKIILEMFHNENSDNKYTKAKLGIKDVEYCKRFCAFLDHEI